MSATLARRNGGKPTGKRGALQQRASGFVAQGQGLLEYLAPWWRSCWPDNFSQEHRGTVIGGIKLMGNSRAFRRRLRVKCCHYCGLVVEPLNRDRALEKKFDYVFACEPCWDMLTGGADVPWVLLPLPTE